MTEFNLSDWIVEHPEGHAIRPCHVKEFIKRLKEININKTGKTLIIPMDKFNKLAGPKLNGN